MKNYRYHNECIRRNQAEGGGGKTRPPGFFPWRLQWGLSVFQWGSNPHNPPPIFTLVHITVMNPAVTGKLSWHVGV